MLIGYGQGFQPVCGFNFGAGKYVRVRNAFRFSAAIMTAYCVLCAAAGFVFAPEIISMFIDGDASVVEYGTLALRWQCVTFPLVGFVVLTNMYLQNIRRVEPAVFVALARQGLFLVPLLFLSDRLFGFSGVLLSQPLSDVLAFSVSVPLALHALKNMGAWDV